jgi:hypothetical protein
MNMETNTEVNKHIKIERNKEMSEEGHKQR